MLEDQIHGPHTTDLEPSLVAGAYVRLLPQEETREVTAAEVVPAVETQEIEVPANSTEEEIEMRGLYAQDGALAQLRLPDPEGGQVQVPPERSQPDPEDESHDDRRGDGVGQAADGAGRSVNL